MPYDPIRVGINGSLWSVPLKLIVSLLPRCAQCGKPIAVRWTRCAWCKSWTGQSSHPADPYRDRVLRSFAYFGVPLGLWVVFAGIVLAHESAGRALLVGSFGAAVALVNLGLLWHPLSWRAAELLWAVGAAGSIVWFWTRPLGFSRESRSSRSWG